MRSQSRCRAYIHGTQGRYRKYDCLNCDSVFSRFLVRPLPKKARLCGKCLELPGMVQQYNEAFDERDKKEKEENGKDIHADNRLEVRPEMGQ